MKTKRIRKSIVRICQITGIVTISVIAVQWLINNSQLEERLKKISIDFYIGAGLSILIYLLQTWRDIQKENAEFIECRENENRETIYKERDKLQNSIGILENRIDSLIIQNSNLKNIQNENVEIIKTIQLEMCKIYNEIHFIKGSIKGTPISVDRLEEKLDTLANRLLQVRNERTDEQ